MLCIFLIVFFFFLGSITENCASWAIRKRILSGGKLLIKKSRFADNLLPTEHRHGMAYWLAKRVPHFVWKDEEGQLWNYTVKEEWEKKWNSRSLIAAWLALWWYDGEIKRYEENNYENERL